MRWTSRVTAAALAAFLMLCGVGPAHAAMETTARSAIVIEAETGRVLFEKDAHAPLPMASTTKIMTALTALTYGDPQDRVTVHPAAEGVEGSSVYLRAGEEMTLEDLLYALILRSGNDAAVAIAYHVGGSIEGFAAMMNELAYAIGAVDSHFVNPHGLDAEDHYTTASDLARITACALEDPRFAAIAAAERKTIPWQGKSEGRTLRNKNRILSMLEGANGVKTGYTSGAGRCLVSSAERDGMQLVCVVLNCGPMFEESRDLLEACFAACDRVKLLEEGTEAAGVSAEGIPVSCALGDDLWLPLAPGEAEKVQIEIIPRTDLTLPVEKGQIVGEAIASLGDISHHVWVLSRDNIAKKQETFFQRLQSWLGF